MDAKVFYIPAPTLVKTRSKFMTIVLFWSEKAFHMSMKMMMHENLSPLRKKKSEILKNNVKQPTK